MEYEKKYKEVQGWIEKIYPTLQHEQQMEAEEFFHELKESEDERIRKEILQSIRDNMVVIHKDKCIAWLEKQEGCEYIKKDWLEHIKQSWYKEGFIDGKYSGGTSKEWTINDAATLKELIDFLENGTAKLQHDLTKYANWLKIQFTPIEKQELKSNPYSGVSFSYNGNVWGMCARDNGVDILFNKKLIEHISGEKQGEQKPANKVEPKFHKGEWVVTSYGKVNQVVAVDKDGDGFTLDDYTYFSGSWKDEYHLWTIKDAKDGDVLASNRSIFIFSQEYIAGKPKAHCGIMNGLFIAKSEGCWTNEECYPATKSQRDTLFAKMKEVGYEWDAEKKELKLLITNGGDFLKSENRDQNPAWSEEDERNLEGIIDEIEANKNDAPDYDIKTYDRFLNWLKSLKDRYTWKPSEEQIYALAWALSLAKNCGEECAFDLRILLEQLKKL